MYHYPQPYKCPKCSHETAYSPDHPWGPPVLSTGPVCPKCWEAFVTQHCGVMVRNIDFSKPSGFQGSQYTPVRGSPADITDISILGNLRDAPK